MTDTTADFGGYFPSCFATPEGDEESDSMQWQHGRVLVGKGRNPPTVHAHFTVHDARSLQWGDPADSAAQCFKARGFSCLAQKSRCTDWNQDYLKGMFNPFVHNEVASQICRCFASG